MTLEIVSSNKSFGGWHKRYRHRSNALNCDMVFAVFLPPQAEQGEKLPVLYWLSGLTCTDENFMQKAGAARMAAELGLIIVAPDTSPRGPACRMTPTAPGISARRGLLSQCDARAWAQHYRMYDYVVEELPALVEANFPVSDRRGISGHSMGGHGALICALKNHGRYRSVSAFAPISNPINCHGEKRRSAAIWARTVRAGGSGMPARCSPKPASGYRCWWTKATAMTSWTASSSRKRCVPLRTLSGTR